MQLVKLIAPWLCCHFTVFPSLTPQAGPQIIHRLLNNLYTRCLFVRCVRGEGHFFYSLLSDRSNAIQLNLSLELNYSATTVTTPFQRLVDCAVEIPVCSANVPNIVHCLDFSRLCSGSDDACILSLSFLSAIYEGSLSRDFHHVVRVARETVCG